MVKVQYYGLVRQLTKVKEEAISAQQVSQVIKEIGKRHGKEALREAKRSFILVNGENAALNKGYKTSLKSGDLVQIMTVTGGG